jgi:hypothetical protein
MKYKVYDQVWTMSDNQPVKRYVYGVLEEMDLGKRGTDITYYLVNEYCGATLLRSTVRKEESLFVTKEELLESL